MNGQLGVIYLLHFSRPFSHAKHYLGWTTNLDERLECHRQGRGAKLVSYICAAGIDFVLARTWTGTKKRERQLKQRGHSRKCPICKALAKGAE